MSVLSRRSNLILFLVMLCLVAIAWMNRFVYDDAFISFRYAQHLAEGHGLVWNIGDAPVEGYTNFLWTLLISVAFILSVDPVLFSWIVGIACFVGSLVATYHLAKSLTDSPLWGIVAVLLLGTNYTFNAFATSGLETQCQAMLLTTSAYLAYRITNSKSIGNRRLIVLSTLFALALLTRLDSAIVVGILGLSTLYHLFVTSKDNQYKLSAFLSLSLPALLIVGMWLIWKLSFYGDILPNTFYAKVGGEAFVYVRGVFYLLGFWLSYWLFPFPFLFIVNLIKRKTPVFDSLLLLIIAIWTAYLLYIGGDFMEFRFMVPILPLLMIAIVSLLARDIDNTIIQWGLVVMIFGGSLSHALTFEQSPFKTHQQSLTEMRSRIHLNENDWDSIGKVLGIAFDYDRSVTIALNPAGFIPFYAQSRTIDMLGLNDRWVAENGVDYLTLAAHEQIATFDYLLEQDVNLLIDQPKMIPHTTVHNYSLDDLDRFHVEIAPEDLPTTAVYLVIPINETHDLLTLYLKPHPTIDRAIEMFDWRTYPTKPS